ncbi:MAG: heme lyase CcmF/NrfE family subunit [Gemmatimonadaceae bacterium]|nr:heme lyase CcmF/NrfE family subunit [Gemmatimonadaceae bacterium]
MMGPLGRGSVIGALVVTALAMVIIPVAARRGRRDWLEIGYAAVHTNLLLLSIAMAAMMSALVTHDFSVGYVAQVGSRATPLLYTIISLWGALEGSILLWGWVLAFYAAAVLSINKHREGNLVPYALAVLMGVMLFFGILLVGPANPFGVVSPVPADGPGPNPLLQNHWLMAVHPPLLYMGYVGMAVPFAFAIGAMLAGEVRQDAWMQLVRRWMLVSWAFLGAAIIAGMWWSYEVLGWGGYWAWDPVENASLMPWLTATAYLHSAMVQERRGMLRLWNVNLVAGTFVLTILGTFLTRSGIISSVHAFTTGTIGYYFLAFIAVVMLFTLVMVAGNSDLLKTEGKLDSAASRETVFLLNNLLLTAFTFTVLVGTLYPLIAEAVRGVKVSVGEPFFDRMSLPLLVLLLFLMGVGPALPWRRTPEGTLGSRLGVPVVGAVLALAIAVLLGRREPWALIAFACIGYALAATLREFATGSAARRAAHGESWPLAFARLVGSNPRRHGGYVAHIGIFLVAIGIAASGGGRLEREGTLARGETLTVGDHTVRLREVYGLQEPQRYVIGARLEVLGADGATIDTLSPRMNFYTSSDQPVPTPDVRSTWSGDLYANLQTFRNDGTTATVKIISEPLVGWIWLGGAVVVFGALIGMLAPRKRLAAEAS